MAACRWRFLWRAASRRATTQGRLRLPLHRAPGTTTLRAREEGPILVISGIRPSRRACTIWLLDIPALRAAGTCACPAVAAHGQDHRRLRRRFPPSGRTRHASPTAAFVLEASCTAATGTANRAWTTITPAPAIAWSGTHAMNAAHPPPSPCRARRRVRRLPAYPGSMLWWRIGFALARRLRRTIKDIRRANAWPSACDAPGFRLRLERPASHPAPEWLFLAISASAQDFLLAAPPGPSRVLQPPPGHGGRHRAGPGGEECLDWAARARPQPLEPRAVWSARRRTCCASCRPARLPPNPDHERIHHHDQP